MATMYKFSGTAEERLAQFLALIDEGKIKAGAFCKVIYERQMSTLAAHRGRVVVKHTEGVYRFGIEYTNTEAFKQLGRESKGLPLSQRRLDGYAQYIQYTIGEDGLPTKLKVVMYTVPENKSKSEYTIDGEPTTWEELTSQRIISASKGKPSPVFTPFLTNIIAISIA